MYLFLYVQLHIYELSVLNDSQQLLTRIGMQAQISYLHFIYIPIYYMSIVLKSSATHVPQQAESQKNSAIYKLYINGFARLPQHKLKQSTFLEIFSSSSFCLKNNAFPQIALFFRISDHTVLLCTNVIYIYVGSFFQPKTKPLNLLT